MFCPRMASASKRLVLMTAAGLIGCSQSAPNQATEPAAVNPVSVVATNSVLCDLTRQLAEDTVDLTCLMAPGQDPHTYQSKPSDRQALDQAELVFYGGYNAEPSLDRSVAASSATGPKVAVYEAAVPEPLMAEVHVHDGHEHNEPEGSSHAEDDHDHDHPEVEATTESASEPDLDLAADPHIWHSAANNVEIVDVISRNLQQVNPQEASRYQENADRLTAEFQAIHGWIQTQVDTVPTDNRELVTPHAAFNYYADAYGLQVKGALSGLSTEEKPTASQVSSLVEQVKMAEVPAVFAETSTSPDLIQTVAKEAGVIVPDQPLHVEGPTGDSQAPTLQAMLVANTCTIVNALGGTCDPATAPES